jgi:hypothetical protein
MRAWLSKASWWQAGLVHVALFGLFMTLYAGFIQDSSWMAAISGGLLGGLVFGLTMGALTARTTRRARAAMGDEEYAELAALPLFRRKQALAGRPDLREAAARGLLHQRDQLRQQRRWAVPVGVLLLALELWAALTRSPWFWFAVALFAAALMSQFVMPAVIDRKVRRLRAPGPGT